MGQSKPWYQSKTIIGVILMVAGIAAGKFGYDLDDETKNQLAGIIATLGETFGAVLAVWGRVSATKAIGT